MALIKYKGGRPIYADKHCVEGGSNSPAPSLQRLSRGISLIEVLISMFVLLFGLMGVAAIFPVASHYIQEGDKRDRSSGLAQIAFEELKSRKYLKPTTWAIPLGPTFSAPFISSSQQFTMAADAGHAFIIDPLGVSAAAAYASTPITGVEYFSVNASNTQNPWRSPPAPQKVLTGTGWPVRRLTFDMDNVLMSAIAMSGQTAETAFTLRDELVTQQPDAGDRPSVQLWRSNNNGTPNDPTDDVMLSRQFNGNYTWLATVVPTRNTALLGMQPSAGIRDEFYEVTSVVFYKRDVTPSATVGSSAGSERLITAEFLNSGELALYSPNSNVSLARQEVDAAVDGVKPTNWIAVCGVNQITGAFMLKWYKILAMDDSTDPVELNDGSEPQGRYLMVDGPEWPEVRTTAGGLPQGWVDLRAIIVPGAIDAYTRVMQLEQE